jgi:hypothetical protein
MTLRRYFRATMSRVGAAGKGRAAMASPSISPTGCIDELARSLEAGEVPPLAVRMRVAAALRRVQQEDDLTIDAALNLSPGAFKRDRRRRRDAIICEAWRSLGGGSQREAARCLSRLARQIQSGRVRTGGDGLTRMLREAIATGVTFPSERQIASILSKMAAQ